MRKAQIFSHLLRQSSPYSQVERLCRFLYWQVIRKRIDKPLCFRLPDGALMNLRSGEHGASGYFYSGYPDFEEMLFLRNFLKPNDLFVDVGANSGGWSLTAFGLGARVIAFEPVGSTFSRLLENFLLNNNSGLRALRYGVSDCEGSLKFTYDADTANKVVSFDSTEKGEVVRVVTLDDELRDMQPAVIKIDVEGHELAVINGAKTILNKSSLKALIIETFRWANFNRPDFQEMERILFDNDFLPVKYNRLQHSFKILRAGEGGQNTIYLKDDWTEVALSGLNFHSF